MKKLLWLISLLLVTFSCYAMEPQNERTDAFEAIVMTSIVSKDTGMEYRYTINYALGNKRDLTGIRILFPKAVPMTEFKVYGKAPRNIEWGGILLESKDIKYLSISPLGKGTRKEIMIDSHRSLYTSSQHLKPGETLEITILSNNETTIPGTVYLEGFCSQAEWVFEDAGDAPRNFDSGYHPKRFKVVGPCPKPVSVEDKIDRLMEFTRNAYDIGLITKYDVLTGLTDKLTAAREKIYSGSKHYQTAANILNAFQNLLDAQHGKAIKEECYQMLLINVNELIAALG